MSFPPFKPHTWDFSLHRDHPPPPPPPLIFWFLFNPGDILLESPAPVIGVSSYEEGAIMWDFMVWTRTENRFKAKYYIGEQVKEVFQKNGIEIPYPHMNVIIEGEKE